MAGEVGRAKARAAKKASVKASRGQPARTKKPAAKRRSKKTTTQAQRREATSSPRPAAVKVSRVQGALPVSDIAVESEIGPIRVFQVKTANVVQQLGGPSRIARILGVAKSQPGRWVRGLESPSATSAKRLLDLDYALSRLEQLYEPETAHVWLTSPNSYLQGARPLDVLLIDGPAEVIDAIDATVAGSYA